MSASTSLQPSEDVTEDPGEGDKEDWDEEDFILPIEYFVEDCKLPSHGIHPAELPKNLVSDEQLVRCFGSKTGKGGRNGHRALYAERILGQKINWAAFAHDKLKNQIKAQKTRKLAKPTGPPCVRTLGVYTPPKSLKFDDNDVPETTPMLEVDAAEAKDKGKLTELQLRGMPAEKSEASGSASPTVCSELSGDLKSFGASPMKSVQIESIERESKLNQRNKEIAMLLEPDDNFDENDFEEVERLDQLEREGEDLTVQMAEVLDAIAASESKEKNLREQIEATKKCREDTESQLLEVTNEISGKEKTLSQDQVEHDWKASSAASKVRRHLYTASGGGHTSQPPTPTSAPASSNVQQLKHVKIEGEKDNVGKSAGPKKRNGPKHSDDTILPPPHKVKTRHATKSEIGTGIDSPSESRTITLKSYKAINTPPTVANTRRKMSLDKVRLMYSQTGNTPCEA
ncbi:hypothetical protein R1sor_006970 [Riccia sorocarpa]|uniref:Uncharacterized protein n=1 Tax=Riccia sorocarpa TaxID=122646 RepID=A0ABD3HVE7_9MARC